MPLLNYSTKVAAEKTVSEVSVMLAKAGARQIVGTFRDGRPVGVAFSVVTPAGERGFVLPVKPEKVERVMSKDPTIRYQFKTRDQAERVAWRIAKDWLEAQLAIVATEMVSLDEVMLPYMTAPGGRTLYQLFVENALPELEA